MRTWIDLNMIVGFPLYTKKNLPFVVSPFSAFVPEPVPDLTADFRGLHPFKPLNLSLHWRGLLERNPSLTPRELAAEVGVTPSRVRQILRLGSLDPELINQIEQLPKDALGKLSESKLRRLVPMSAAEQLLEFEKMVTRLEQ